VACVATPEAAAAPGPSNVTDTEIEALARVVEPRLPVERNWAAVIFQIIAFPFTMLFMITVVDCRKERLRKWYPLTFLVSIVYIAVFCQFMVSWGLYIGCYLSIPDEIMGLTLLAIGSSVPELFSASTVARQGYGVSLPSNTTCHLNDPPFI